jgi:hypothetical protein
MANWKLRVPRVGAQIAQVEWGCIRTIGRFDLFENRTFQIGVAHIPELLAETGAQRSTYCRQSFLLVRLLP